jgi:hypothetical protein
MFANSFQADDNNNVIAEYDDFLPFPHEDIDAVQVVEACMNTLLSRKDAGLEVCWNFSSDRCRVSQKCCNAILRFSNARVALNIWLCLLRALTLTHHTLHL